MRLRALLTTAAWIAAGASAMAQVSSEAARNLGLEVAWQGQVQLPRAKGIASAHLWAESSGARQFAVVELKNGRTIQVAADELDRDGKPIGLDAAKLRAQQQAQFHSFDANGDGLLVPAEVPALGRAFTAIDRDLDGQISQAEHSRFIDWNTLISTTLGKNDADRMLKSKGVQEATQLLTAPSGFEASVLSIPRIKLVIVTQNGSIETLDAETGQTIWSNTCGDAAVPTFAAALSKAGIVVVQGDHLYVLDWENGKQLVNKRLQRASSNSVAATNTMAFVSDFSGRVESYAIGESKFIQRWGYVMRGRSLGETVNLLERDLCGVASADGFFYVFSGAEAPEVWLRYQSSTPIEGCIGAGNNAFYVGNAGGRLSKIVINDRLGTVSWEYLTGHAFASAPLIVGKYTFAATDDGVLNCINDFDGTEAWSSHSVAVREPVAVANNLAICRTQANEIVGFNIENGEIVGRAQSRNLSQALHNQLSDRVYLLGRQGQLVCLRPIGSTVPKLTKPIELEQKTEAKETPVAPPAETPMNDAGENPFGGSDPFGGAEGAPDPFGTGM